MERKTKALAIGALIAGGLAAMAVRSGSAFSYGGPEIRKGISRDPKLLLPTFAAKVELLFQALRARGEDPLLWEGYRTPARAIELEKRGTGSRKSLHSYGAAVDIVDSKLFWSNPKFFEALGQEAKKLGLTWGGDWKGDEYDAPHVQAVPSTSAVQNALRASTNPDDFIKRYIG